MSPQDSSVRSAPKAVAAWAAASPSAVAVASPEGTLTYAELNNRANRLARRLRAQGVGPEVLVGLCVDRSAAFVVAALGILQANGAYLPIDPAQPSDRIEYMVNEANVAVVVASQRTAPRLSACGSFIFLLEEGPLESTGATGALPSIQSHPEQLAYVIYTSGSTGRPKGVEITHGSLQNLVAWHQRAFNVTRADRATLMSSPGFDAAVWELWPYLASGASVHLPDDTTRRSPDLLRDWLVAQRITVSFAVTPIAERLLDMDWPAETKLRLLLTGGDTLNRYPGAGLPFRLVNNYGPTESTVVATSGVIPPCAGSTNPPTIGRPIANVEIHILDEHLRPAPEGTAGELCIAGAGLARGYVNDPEATARSFVRNPFSRDPRARLYRTGDLARYEPDGQITFLGRLDDQLKIRGHRIEPGEVVRALLSHPSIRASAVLACNDRPGENQLVGYIVFKPGHAPTHSVLCEHLRTFLPEYMIPSAFVPVDDLPVTSNGKIDRAALPPPTPSNVLRDGNPQRVRSVVEARVAAILSTLLGLNDIDTDANFFLLGGHSLLGAQVIASLRETFDVEVTLRSLFEAPTVAGLSAEIERLINAEVAALGESEIRRLLSVDGTDNQWHP